MQEIPRSFITVLKKRLKENNPLIQLIIGPRQVGKTTGMLQFLEIYKYAYHYVSADDVVAGDREWMVEAWQAALLKGDNTLLVIDEIQKIDQWAETIKKLWDEQQRKKSRIKLIILGSSSLSLTKGASESLAGRFEMIKVYHWDFLESQKFSSLTLEQYLRYGGYPRGYHYLDDETRWRSYIGGAVIDRVIDKDILQFAAVKKPALFRQAFDVICCYPAQEISYNKILGQLQDKGNTDLVKHYLSLFEAAYLIKTLPKYMSQSFKRKSSSPKILIMAPCLYELFDQSGDKLNFVFESTVGAKLLELSEHLTYWREGNKEVDFILEWRKQLYAIEVKSGRKKRAGGLDAFLTLYPHAHPIIISRDNYNVFLKDPGKFLERLTH